MTPTPLRLLLAASLVLLAAGCGGSKTDGTKGGYVTGNDDIRLTRVAPEDRKAAPVIEGEDLDGNQISTEDFAGKTIVINVWGSWCPPCRAEAPALNAVAKAMKPKGVEFLGISVREDAGTTRAFIRKHGSEYPTISDTSGRLSLGFVDSLPSVAVPTTWIVDANGKVAVRIADKTTESTLTGLIEDVQESTK